MLEKIKKSILDILADLVGTLLVSSGIFCFADSADIAPGGVSGIAIMLRHLFGLPIGLLTLAINLPLLLIALRFVGRGFALRSFRTLLINTFMLDLVVAPYFPVYSGDRILASIFGGVVIGAGLSVVFHRGSSTAGTDIISVMIEKRYPHIGIGKALMLIDSVIIAASAFVFRDIDSVMYAVITIFCQSKIINAIVYGTKKGRSVLIISRESAEIASYIMNELDRGATYLSAEGAYTGKSTKVLMCVVRVWEYRRLKDAINKIDPDAFLVSTETQSIVGKGFV